MSVSRASVHPIETPPLRTEAAIVPRVRMKDIQGMPGTINNLFLRFAQFVFASIALSVMASTSDFSSVTPFCYFVAAAGLQILWIFSLGILDIYALHVGRSLQNQRIVSFFSIGDGGATPSVHKPDNNRAEGVIFHCGGAFARWLRNDYHTKYRSFRGATFLRDVQKGFFVAGVAFIFFTGILSRE